MAAKRILCLHESALSHAEYTQYVESFNDLVEGDRSQNPSVSVPEARGWLKGRYATNNTVDAATIDKVLQLSLIPRPCQRRQPAILRDPKAKVQEAFSPPGWLTSGYPIPTYTRMLTIPLLFCIFSLSFRFSASFILNSLQPIRSRPASSTQSSA